MIHVTTENNSDLSLQEFVKITCTVMHLQAFGAKYYNENVRHTYESKPTTLKERFYDKLVIKKIPLRST